MTSLGVAIRVAAHLQLEGSGGLLVRLGRYQDVLAPPGRNHAR
jgi:hypothetical protein